MIRYCKKCIKLHTKNCPIRVWGRVEGQRGLFLDVDVDKDYCSRFEKNYSTFNKVFRIIFQPRTNVHLMNITKTK
jgi:hypothetical protein